MGDIGWPELVILLVVVVVMFGGTKLAGLGKGAGRALREFKEETQGLVAADPAADPAPTARPTASVVPVMTAVEPVAHGGERRT